MAPRGAHDVFLPAAGQGGGAGGQGRIFGMNRWVVVGAAVVGLIAAYLIYRHYQSGGGGSSSSVPSATDTSGTGTSSDLSGGSGSPTDTSTTPTGVDTGALDTLTSDLSTLLDQLGQSAQTPAQAGGNYYFVVPTGNGTTPNGVGGAKTPAGGAGTKTSTASVNVPQKVSGSGPTTLSSFNTIPAELAGGLAGAGAAAGADIGSFATTSYGGYVPAAAPNTPLPKSPTAPYTVTATANPSGASATRKQGIISVH